MAEVLSLQDAGKSCHPDHLKIQGYYLGFLDLGWSQHDNLV
jgi:hypothetical protein